jgi:hypothetical protein
MSTEESSEGSEIFKIFVYCCTLVTKPVLYIFVNINVQDKGDRHYELSPAG